MVYDDAELAAELEEQNLLFKEIAKEVAGFFASASKTSHQSQWTEVRDDQGKSYYWNQVTNETSWDKPPGFDEPPPLAVNKSIGSSSTSSSSQDEALESELQVQKTLHNQLNAEMQYWVNLAKEQAKIKAAPVPPAPEEKRPLPPSPRPAPPSPSPRPPPPSSSLMDPLAQHLADERAEQDKLARQILAESQHWIQVAKAQPEPSAPVALPVEEPKKAPPPSPKLPPPSPKLPPPSPKVPPPSPKPPAEESQRALRAPPPSPGPRPPPSPAAASSSSVTVDLEKNLAEERVLQEDLQRQIRAETVAFFEKAKQEVINAPLSVETKVESVLPPPPSVAVADSPRPPRPAPPSPAPPKRDSTADDVASEQTMQDELKRQILTETAFWFEAARKAKAALPPPVAAPPSPKQEVKAPPPRPAPPSPAPRPPTADRETADLERNLAEERDVQQELKRQIRAEEQLFWDIARKTQVQVGSTVPAEPPRVSTTPPPSVSTPRPSSPPPASPPPPRPVSPPPRPPVPVSPKPPPPSPGVRPPPPKPAAEQELKSELSMQEELMREIRAEEKKFFEDAKKAQAATSASAAPPTSDWVAVVDGEGKTYYWNQKTDQTSWDKPEGFGESDDAAKKKEEDKQREEEEQRKKEVEAKRQAEEEAERTKNELATKEREEKEAKEKKDKEAEDEEAKRKKSEEKKSAWEAVQDGEGKTYYWNKDTNETSWDKPPGFEDKADANLEEEYRLKEELKLAAEKEEKDKLLAEAAEKEAKDKETKEREEKEKAEEAERALAKKKESPWEAVQDGEGKTYYWNKDTNETSWDKPPGFGGGEEESKEKKEEEEKKKQLEKEEAEKEKSKREEEEEKAKKEKAEKEQAEEEEEKKRKQKEEEEKGKGWKAIKNTNGETYYWNQKTDETSWDKPPGFVDEEEEEKVKKAQKEKEEEEEKEAKRKKEIEEENERKEKEEQEKYNLAVAKAKELEEKHSSSSSLRPSPPPPSSLPPLPPSSSSSSLPSPPPPASVALPLPPLKREKTSPPPPITIPTTPPSVPTQRIFAISASSPSPSPKPPPPRPPLMASPRPSPPPPLKEAKVDEGTLEEELAEQQKLKSSIAELESNFMIEAETRLVTVPDTDKKASWVAVKDADGGVYYWNQETGATTWLRPEDFEGPVIDPNAPSPKGDVVEATVEQKLASQLTPDEFTRHLEEALNTTAWKQVATPDGDKYWWNQDTGETSWLEPERVQVDPIIPKALALTSRREASAQRAEARARLKKELEQLDKEEREAGENSALVEQKSELSHYDDVEHLGQAAELLMASMGGADRQRIQELEAKVESLQQTNVALVRKLIEVQDDRHGLSVKLINLLENQAKAAEDLRNQKEGILQNAQRVAAQIIADAEKFR